MKIAALAVAAIILIGIVVLIVALANAPTCVCGDPECGGGCAG